MSADPSARWPGQRPSESGGALPADGTPAEVLFSVGVVARRLGVAAATLRTWDRRYGLGPSSHLTGSHRRYSVADLRRLKHMRRLILAGVPAADAARLVLHGNHDPGTGPGETVPIDPSIDLVDRRRASPAVAGSARGSGARSSSGPDVPPNTEVRSGGSGGRILALPGGDAAQRGLAAAAMALDSGAIADLVMVAIHQRGVVSMWTSLVVPVLVAIGKRWERTGDGVEVEHLLANTIDGVLKAHQAAVRRPAAGRPALLTAAPNEQHVLALSALAAALTERGVRCLSLGSQTPSHGLVAAVRRVGPGAVVVWSQVPQTADLAALSAVPRTRPPAAVIAAGPGWDRELLPQGVTFADSLAVGIRLVANGTGHSS